MILKNLLFEGKLTDITIENGTITAIEAASGKGEGTDCSGLTVIPGLVDMHTHGCAGYDTMDAQFEEMSVFLAKNGTTAWLPTTMTQSYEAIRRVTEASREVSGAQILGFHMEGPYINATRKGAQNGKFIKDPDLAEFKSLDGMKVVTIAPELAGSIEFIKECGALVCIGHTDADYDTCIAAIEAGANCLTHTFNAMPGIHHRNPGPIGAAVAKNIYVQAITDGLHLHPAIVNFLDLKKDAFYCMEMTTKGRSYVTARGWEDLSQMLLLYEEEELAVEESLVGQYIRNDRIVKEFTAYYDLFNKYKKDYHINAILAGNAPAQAVEKAKTAAFDERLSLLGMLLDRVQADMKDVMEQAAYLKELQAPLVAVKEKAVGADGASDAGAADADRAGAGNAGQSGKDIILTQLSQITEVRRKKMENLQMANSLSEADRRRHLRVLRFLEECQKGLYTADAVNAEEAFGVIREKYDGDVANMKQETTKTKAELEALFAFAEAAFAEGNEMLILVTELTVHNASAQFIATFGSEAYNRHNKDLMLGERSNDIKAQIASLGI